jgi:deoxyribodipyrimidine photo-lyase
VNFPTTWPEIWDRVKTFSPEHYGRTRNFKDGSVSHLSPFISRGVISTKDVLEILLKKDLPWSIIEKFVQELAWRDYWQQIWVAKKNLIDKDLKQRQEPITHHKIPKAIIEGNTGVIAVDKAIEQLYSTGYMHNHMRMYVASITCNISRAHWLAPAQWMYSLLLDGDWASNALSWQWVAGSNSHKKYFANQENINKFFYSDQRDTFLDVSYEEFPDLTIPERLRPIGDFKYEIFLPATKPLKLDTRLPTLIYNYYNLDPRWHEDELVNRIFLLEPDFFQRYPVTQKCLDFALALARNIEGIQIYVGSFHELARIIEPQKTFFKEHPTNSHYQGQEEPRDWMFNISGYYHSFFSYWKKCKKELS